MVGDLTEKACPHLFVDAGWPETLIHREQPAANIQRIEAPMLHVIFPLAVNDMCVFHSAPAASIVAAVVGLRPMVSLLLACGVHLDGISLHCCFLQTIKQCCVWLPSVESNVVLLTTVASSCSIVVVCGFPNERTYSCL